MSETEETSDSPPLGGAQKRKRRAWLRHGSFGLAALVLLLTLPMDFWSRLLFGWFAHLKQTLPEIRWNFGDLLQGLLLAGIAVVALALLLRSWRKEMRFLLKTAVGMCLVATLLFGTCLASIGILQQTAWLLGSKWVELDYSNAQQARHYAFEIHSAFWKYLEHHPQKDQSGLERAFERWLQQDRDSCELAYSFTDDLSPAEKWQFVSGNWLGGKTTAPVLISPRKIGGYWAVATFEGHAGWYNDDELAALKREAVSPPADTPSKTGLQ